MKKINLGIVGATGQVGHVLLDILEKRNFPLSSLRLFSSARSKGKKVEFSNANFSSTITVEDVESQEKDTLRGLDVVIFSAGGKASTLYAPLFEDAGAVVIDNSSAWRKNEDIPLVVSEVNPEDLEGVFTGGRRIIANPNCTTMAAMPVLKPLHSAKTLRSLSIATYQAVSGAGVAGVSELAGQARAAVKQDLNELAKTGRAVDFPEETVFAGTIAFNVLAYAGNLVADTTLETDEEQKLRFESRKILHIPSLRVQGTCVRVPVFSGHSLCVQAQFEESVTPLEAVQILRSAPGVQVFGSADASEVESALNDERLSPPKRGESVAGVPTPLLATGKDVSMVGRIRNDHSLEDPSKGLSLFICADNLRKGAALNTVQIAEHLIERL